MLSLSITYRYVELGLVHILSVHYNSPASRQHNHKRFDAFAVMGQGCDQQCIGGACRQDTSKITCGVTHDNMVAPCVVYSIGGNNQWQFEQGILDHTPCDVHTFDCTGPITRFDKKPNTVRGQNKTHQHHERCRYAVDSY